MSWNLKYFELETEILAFKKVWHKSKTCKCRTDVCKHLKPLIAEKFNDRIDALLQEAINEGFTMMGAEAPYPAVGKMK